MTTNIISNTPLGARNEWRTPPEIFAWASKLVGGFDYDTACTKANALAKPIWDHAWNPDYALPYGDALAEEWQGVLWCNPPYDDIDTWAEKAICSGAITAMFIPQPNGEDRYADLIRHAHETAINGRISFLAGSDFVIPGKPARGERPATPDRLIKEGEPVSGNTRGSSLFIINGYGKGSRSIVDRDWILREFAIKS